MLKKKILSLVLIITTIMASLPLFGDLTTADKLWILENAKTHTSTSSGADNSSWVDSYSKVSSAIQSTIVLGAVVAAGVVAYRAYQNYAILETKLELKRKLNKLRDELIELDKKNEAQLSVLDKKIGLLDARFTEFQEQTLAFQNKNGRVTNYNTALLKHLAFRSPAPEQEPAPIGDVEWNDEYRQRKTTLIEQIAQYEKEYKALSTHHKEVTVPAQNQQKKADEEEEKRASGGFFGYVASYLPSFW